MQMVQKKLKAKTMKFIRFKQFEKVADMSDTHSLNEVTEAMSGSVDQDTVQSIFEFFGIGKSLLNWASGKIPGGAVKTANKILQEYEGLYKEKATEEINMLKKQHEINIKHKQAAKNGNGSDSIEAAMASMQKAMDLKKKANADKWAAIEASLDVKIKKLKKENEGSDRIQTYIDVRLTEMRVKLYTALEKAYDAYATEDQVEFIANTLEQEKKKFKEYMDRMKLKSKNNALKTEDVVEGGLYKRVSSDKKDQIVKVLSKKEGRTDDGKTVALKDGQFFVENQKTKATYIVDISSFKEKAKDEPVDTEKEAMSAIEKKKNDPANAKIGQVWRTEKGNEVEILNLTKSMKDGAEQGDLEKGFVYVKGKNTQQAIQRSSLKELVKDAKTAA